MRVVFISDIHGSNFWEPIVSHALINNTQIVFLGDYVDSHDNIPLSKILSNLKEIIKAKRKYPQLITLLLGNHDCQYIYDDIIHPRYDEKLYKDKQKIKPVFDKNVDLFDIAWGYQNPQSNMYTLATHAGVTQEYWNLYIDNKYKKDPNTVIYKAWQGTTYHHEILNNLKLIKNFMWMIGPSRKGWDVCGSPIWEDSSWVFRNPLKEVNQIFSHTKDLSPRFKIVKNNFLLCIETFSGNSVEIDL